MKVANKHLPHFDQARSELASVPCDADPLDPELHGTTIAAALDGGRPLMVVLYTRTYGAGAAARLTPIPLASGTRRGPRRRWISADTPAMPGRNVEQNAATGSHPQPISIMIPEKTATVIAATSQRRIASRRSSGSPTDNGTTWSKNLRVTDRIVDRRIGVFDNDFDVSAPPGLATSNDYIIVGWDDTLNATPVELGAGTQDLFTAAVQYQAWGEAPPGQSKSPWRGSWA